MVKPKNYSLAADIIRTLAIIGVVTIHTANSVFERPDFFGGISWWLSIILNSVSRIAVPLFIMLSGYFMLGRDRPFKTTLDRILKRLLLPLLFWTTFTYVAGDPKNFLEIFKWEYYLRFFSGNVFYYYFLVILAGLYFISPLLRSYIKAQTLSNQKRTALMFLGVGAAQAIVFFLSKTCALENAFTKWVPFTGLFLLGHLIGTGSFKNIETKSWKAIYFSGLLATIALNYIYYSKGSVEVLRSNYPSCLSHYSDYYLSLNVIAMTVSAFAILFFAKFDFLKNTIAEKIIYSVSRLSFGIYLVHLIVVALWDKGLGYDVDHAGVPLWLYLIIRISGVFIISFILSKILNRFSFTRKLIGGN